MPVNDALKDAGEADLVFDVIGGDIGKRPAGVIGGTPVTIAGRPEARPADGLVIDFVAVPDRAPRGRSPGGSGTDGCGHSSATSRPPTTPSPPSTRPSGSPER